MQSSCSSHDIKQQMDFENYTNSSHSYDETRIHIGIEVVLGCFVTARTKPLHEQVILDAGCGTGNYLEAIVDKVGRCV